MSVAISGEYHFDIQAELDRKSVEALHELIRRHENEDISTEAYVVALQALNNALRGLVDDEIIAAVDAEINQMEPEILDDESKRVVLVK